MHVTSTEINESNPPLGDGGDGEGEDPRGCLNGNPAPTSAFVLESTPNPTGD